ncbi:MarR family transcriptional regulator [Nocardioides marmoriginsengisoli]|uniref:MarR family transcriptional regulator n=1 Tax=Nocardioides marmoriginsengisoli TaxID=661483 RepID=A0A3N0CK15_9ACTN|nr:MarR family transcriptional regulator [Nocardioides marmoriginsengisoli]RNL63782.1 MarR family transcriptional regulator [Nocardioides marmoriginsengisoli]
MSTPANDDTARLYLAIGRLNRALRRDAREALVGHGGLSALASLIADGPQRAGALAVVEGVTAPAMTRILNSLESLGYVVRTPDPADRRASVVAATPAGEALVLHGRAARLQALQERLDQLDESSRHALVAALGALEELTREG